MLATSERRVLEAVCDTLFPSLEPRQGDAPPLFAANARTVGVPAAAEDVLGELDPPKQLQLRLLLRALDQPVVMRLLAGKWHAFTKLLQKDRERALLALATSKIP